MFSVDVLDEFFADEDLSECRLDGDLSRIEHWTDAERFEKRKQWENAVRNVRLVRNLQVCKLRH